MIYYILTLSITFSILDLSKRFYPVHGVSDHGEIHVSRPPDSLVSIVMESWSHEVRESWIHRVRESWSQKVREPWSQRIMEA